MTLYLGLFDMQPASFWLFLTLFTVVMFASAKLVHYTYQRRVEARLQEQVRNMLCDYVALDGGELETITFTENNARSLQVPLNDEQSSSFRNISMLSDRH